MDAALKQQLTQTLQQAQPKIALAYVFGSVANGTAKPNSDIDIAILCPQINAKQKMALWQKIADLTDRSVDWIDLNDAGALITFEALKGERIIGTNQQHAQLLSRTLIDASDYGRLYNRILNERRDAWLKE